jgi:hypothetical protein
MTNAQDEPKLLFPSGQGRSKWLRIFAMHIAMYTVAQFFKAATDCNIEKLHLQPGRD